MEQLLSFLRRQTPARLAAGAVVFVLMLAIGGYGAYAVFGPTARGVLPLPPSDFVQGEFLVRFKPGAARSEMAAAHASSKATEKDEIPGLGIGRLTVPPGSSVGEMVNAYKRNPNVLYAEPNYLSLPQALPNDPKVVDATQWSIAKVNASQAWDITQGDPSVIIAIVDSGVRPDHEDLASKLVPGYNYYDNNTTTADLYGHGTQVAGVAAAATNNGLGMAGMCPLCKIMPLRVTSSTGSASSFATAQAIAFAANNGAKVINISLGWGSAVSAIQDAIDDAWSKGVLTVVAAGNLGTTPLVFPGSKNATNVTVSPPPPHNVLAVGMTNSTDSWIGSNYGAPLDVVAPGYQVSTTTKAATNSYSTGSGSSFASPLVAGIGGLLMSVPGMTNANAIALIKGNTVQPATYDAAKFGTGRVDACKTLKAAVPSSPVTCSAAATTQSVATATTAPAATATTAPVATATTAAVATATTAAPVATATTVPVATATTAAAATATTAPAATATTAPAATATTAPAATATTAAVATAPAATATPASTLKTETFAGTVNATGTKTINHTITLAGPGTVTANLSGWGGNPSNNNLNLFLFSGTNPPAGAVALASAATANRPEIITFNATAAGTYTLQVVAAAGSGTYTLATSHP